MKYVLPFFVVLLAVTLVPANATWVWEYHVNYTGTAVWNSSSPGVGHSRSVSIAGEDDFVFNNTGRPGPAGAWGYGALIFNGCTGATDMPIFAPPTWVNPAAPTDTIGMIWNWGIPVDVANNQIFVTNQDAQYSICVFDLTGAPTPYRNELGFWGQNTYYPSQACLDATGNIYLANYGMSWIPDASPAVGNICWYPAIASDPDWATGGASPHNPALMGIYSAIQGATQAYGQGLMSYDGATFICEGVDVSADGSILVYTSRGGASQGVHVALGSPSTGYVLSASNEATLGAYWTWLTADAGIANVRGCKLAPDEEHIFFVVDDTVPRDCILVWNWVTGEYKDPIWLGDSVAGPNPTTNRIIPADMDTSTLPYDVDVAEDDGGSAGTLNVVVGPYYNWTQSIKFNGDITTLVDQWYMY